MSSIVQQWPSPTRRSVRGTSRIPQSTARAEVYGSTLPCSELGSVLICDWSPVGTGAWSTPEHLQAIISLVSNPLETEVTATSELDHNSLRDQIAFTRHYLSLSVAEFARLVGVERPAVYAWADGENEPRPANHEQLNRLYRAALEVRSHLGQPLGVLLRTTTSDQPRSLFDLLAAGAEGPDVEKAINSLATSPHPAVKRQETKATSAAELMRGRVRALSIAGRRRK